MVFDWLFDPPVSTISPILTKFNFNSIFFCFDRPHYVDKRHALTGHSNKKTLNSLQSGGTIPLTSHQPLTQLIIDVQSGGPCREVDDEEPGGDVQ